MCAARVGVGAVVRLGIDRDGMVKKMPSKMNRGGGGMRGKSCASLFDLLLLSSPSVLCYDAFRFFIFMMDTTLERHDGADWAYHSTLGFFHTHTHWHLHSDSLYTHWLFDLWLSLTPCSALLCSL